MDHRSRLTDQTHPAPVPPDVLPATTRWTSLATAFGTAEALPAALALLTDADPGVREAALRDALGAVTHQNTIYEATVPVALYVAAILSHPTLQACDDPDAGTQHRPALVQLLEWLGETAYDANDESAAFEEQHVGEGPDEPMRAFRDARPAIHSAVRPFLDHENAAVRHTALVASIPLIEHPVLARHQAELTEHARRLLDTSTDRHHRDRTLNALNSWGHDTSGLENASDRAARVRHARLRAAHEAGKGGYSDEPPF
ncbi:hypothetical protein ACWEPZ_31570 [Streptomyces sp. NPDC004288]